MTKYAKKHPYRLAISVLLLGIIVLLALGYRLQPNLSVAKNGKLQVMFPMASTTIYIDNKKIDTQGTENETVTTSLSVKTHTVIISRLGYFPWTKDVAISPDKTTIIKPIFVTQNTTGQIITKNDSQYWKIRAEVNAVKLPTEDFPVQQIYGESTLWIENNTIYIQKYAESSDYTMILTPKDTVRSLDFYKDRNDAIIFASDTGVYVVEAVQNAVENKANFFPIYTGTRPIFKQIDNSFLYVLDGENLLQVVI